MSTTVCIPDSLYKQAQEIAAAQHVPVGEVIASALEDHLAAWDRLKRKASGGSRDAFLQVLDNVPDNEPADYDRL